MTKKALAARLTVSEKYLDKLVSAKEIPFIKLGKLVRFRFKEIEKWLHERSHNGN
jgi:excisionase family DNA binding protein